MPAMAGVALPCSGGSRPAHSRPTAAPTTPSPSVTPMRYEYESLLVDDPWSPSSLNTLGAAGWEAYAVTWSERADGWWIWFKRPVAP